METPTSINQTPNTFIAHATDQVGRFQATHMHLVITEQTTFAPTVEPVQGGRQVGKCLVVQIPTRLLWQPNVAKSAYF
jgi:hypothetical protein